MSFSLGLPQSAVCTVKHVPLVFARVPSPVTLRAQLGAPSAGALAGWIEPHLPGQAPPLLADSPRQSWALSPCSSARVLALPSSFLAKHGGGGTQNRRA